MTTLLKADGKPAQATLPVTCDQEIQAIVRDRRRSLATPDAQDAVRDVMRRHYDAGLLTLTDAMLLPDVAFLVECWALGMRWDAEDHSVKPVGTKPDGSLEEPPWPEGVRLTSLIKNKDGVYQAIRNVKVGQGGAATSVQRRALEIRHRPLYPTMDFLVDAKTGAFQRLVPVRLAMMLLRNHGLPFLQGKDRALMVCVHPRGTHEPGFCRSPNGLMDRAILAERAYVDGHAEILDVPERSRMTQNIVAMQG